MNINMRREHMGPARVARVKRVPKKERRGPRRI